MTAQDIIDKALQRINVIAPGQTPATEERNDALIALNNLIQSWNAEQVTLFAVTLQTVTLSGAASYSLATRPRRIKAATVLTTAGAGQAPMLVDAAGWASILDKSRTGLFAEALYCDYAYPSATVSLTPKPASGTLEIYSYTPLSTYASLSTNQTLPDGYDRALIGSLAVELATEYGRPVDEALLQTAVQAKQAITQLNALVLGEAMPGQAASVQAAR